VPSAGGDIGSVCVPRFLHLCEPCSASKDCESLGLKDSACVDQGPLGKFCSVSCAGEGDCPADYACAQVPTAEGGALKQCVKNPDAQQKPYGVCGCTAAAVQKKLSTACYVEVKDAEGKTTSKCTGVRTCTGAGLSTCAAPKAKAEVCNGQDDDCDGQTDEASCDDGKACTQDSCAGVDGCKYKLLDGEPCDADGSVCTEGDACQAGGCLAGVKKDCDDKNPCTTDSCDIAKGCTQVADDGKPCEDDNPCTLGDVCQTGQCEPGAPKVCATPDGCTTAKCSLQSGTCKYGEAPAKTPCDDGLPCTAQDACSGGSCQGQPKVCDDANPCTEDYCDSKQGCAVKPQGALPCDDGNACTGPDLCEAGGCSGKSKACDDNNLCTADSCDPSSGCSHLPVSAACDDGNPCTQGDGCAQGQCVAGASTCACQKDSDCPDDGDLCNGVLVCDKSGGPGSNACKVKAGSAVACDTAGDSACAKVQCQPKTGQCTQVAAANGSPCDDGSACTSADTCAAGSCLSSKAVDCDDNNPCTADSCAPQQGCQHVATQAQACDADGSVCTAGDQCQAGVCVKGKAQICDDANPCTDDSCDAAKGCQAVATAGACDDGNPCTQGDACSQGTCTAGKSVCGCEKDADCPNDGDLCNGLQVCDTSKVPYQCALKAGSVVQCNTAADGPCKLTSCVAQSGNCVTANAADGQSCSDGSACTSGDQCQAGSCQAGTAVGCDDKNPCTTDSCAPTKGCVFLPQPGWSQGCYPGAAGTQGKGICVGGKQTCDEKGVLGVCVGAVGPAAKEACNGQDDTCDGQTDEGCKVADFEVAEATLRYQGSGGSYVADVRIGQAQASDAASAIGGKIQAWLGSWRWWKGVSP
jgi:hypothetical protein